MSEWDGIRIKWKDIFGADERRRTIGGARERDWMMKMKMRENGVLRGSR